jgi:ubiquinone/menaquinone biosynthesis C-methylase UbiE
MNGYFLGQMREFEGSILYSSKPIVGVVKNARPVKRHEVNNYQIVGFDSVPEAAEYARQQAKETKIFQFNDGVWNSLPILNNNTSDALTP